MAEEKEFTLDIKKLRIEKHKGASIQLVAVTTDGRRFRQEQTPTGSCWMTDWTED